MWHNRKDLLSRKGALFLRAGGDPGFARCLERNLLHKLQRGPRCEAQSTAYLMKSRLLLGELWVNTSLLRVGRYFPILPLDQETP